MFFDGFPPPSSVSLADGTAVRYRRAGRGPVVLLLHGHPQTHAIWHHVAPLLIAAGFDGVCPDLPGYGGTAPDARNSAERGTKAAMASVLLGFADALGIERFTVVGHDRGARVAAELAAAAPERVAACALLDAVPTVEPIERSDMAQSLATYRAFWFAQKHPKPESLVRGTPDEWLRGALPGGEEDAGRFHPEAVADYVAAGRDPEGIAEAGDAYRRASELDRTADRIARAAGRGIRCPLLVLWGGHGAVGGWYDPLALWRAHEPAASVGGEALEAGHYLVEECPEAIAAGLIAFMRAS